MKGVLMKVGQLVSFIAEGLPDEAQAALAALQADAAPMSPTLAAGVVDSRARRRARAGLPPLGRPARRRGQHRPGPPGRDRRGPPRSPSRCSSRASRGDRGGPRRRRGDVHRVLGAGAQRPRRPRPRRRAARPHARGARLPPRGAQRRRVRPATSPATRGCASRSSCPSCPAERVLTTEWIDGMSWDQFVATAPQETKQRAGEVIWRFGQHSIQRLGAFNGDPHPGNYRFHHDGSVTFLDFGLVKRWDARRVGAARAEPRRHRRAPRPRAARRRRWSSPASSPTATASIRSRSTTTCPARTARTSSTSSRSPGTGCARRWRGSSTSTARTPR